MYTILSAGELYLASSLNYETQVTYNFTFSVRDTYLPGLTYKMLYLQVNDINEAPSLTLHTTSLSTTEGNVSVPYYPLPDDKILDWSKLKQIADDILEYI